MIFGAGVATAQGAGAFLQAGFGSRPTALANNFTAVANDANAVYWNAAGLAAISSQELTGMYERRFDEVANVDLAYVLPAGKLGSFGLGLVRSSVDGIPETDNFGNLSGFMSNTDQAFFLSYGKNISERLALGSSFKLVSQTLNNNNNGGYDLDLSALARPNDRLSLGLAVQNVLEGKIGPDQLERRVRVGLALEQAVKNLLIATDFDLNSGAAGCGLEWSCLPFFKVRAGVDENRLFGGLGLTYSGYSFDYSFNAHELGNVSTVAISVKD